MKEQTNKHSLTFKLCYLSCFYFFLSVSPRLFSLREQSDLLILCLKTSDVVTGPSSSENLDGCISGRSAADLHCQSS